jgi:uncharacterized protein YkvS
MGNSGAQSVDMTEAPVTLKDGLSGLVSKVCKSSSLVAVAIWWVGD